MGALGTEVIGKAEAGRGAQYWVDGKARPDGECGINTSGGLIAKGHPVGATWNRHDRLGGAAIARQGTGGVTGGRPEAGRHIQYRRPDLRQRLHRAAARVSSTATVAPSAGELASIGRGSRTCADRRQPRSWSPTSANRSATCVIFRAMAAPIAALTQRCRTCFSRSGIASACRSSSSVSRISYWNAASPCSFHSCWSDFSM